jgi:hypothetical protein
MMMARLSLIVLVAMVLVATGCTAPSSTEKTTYVATFQPWTIAESTERDPGPLTTVETVTMTASATDVPTAVASKTPTQECARPGTGTSLLPGAMAGSMYLTVDNRNDADAVVTLRVSAEPAESGSRVLCVFVRAHDTWTVRNVEPGTYTLWYELGECWDADTGRFVEDPGAYRSDEPLTYLETTDGYRVQISNTLSRDAPAQNGSRDLA